MREAMSFPRLVRNHAPTCIHDVLEISGPVDGGPSTTSIYNLSILLVVSSLLAFWRLGER